MKALAADLRFRIFLAVIGACTILLGTTYVLVQQSTRLAADDLPLATAQTIKHQLENGVDPNEVIPTTKTSSLSDNTVFAIVTDSTPHVLATSLTDDQSALPPKGVFDYTATHGNDHFTWQTASGARLATRVLSYKSTNSSGYVIAGQSLAQAEHRISNYGLFALVAWVVVVAWTFLLL